MRASQLTQRGRALLVGERPGVPGELVLHERDALTLHRVRDDDGWPAGSALVRVAQRVDNLGHVVAVYLLHPPAEGRPAGCDLGLMQWHALAARGRPGVLR